MPYEDTLIRECLNGERDPDCDDCPAHSSKGGACCFGLRHEYGDKDCTACSLEEECARLTHRPKIPARSLPRIIHPTRSFPNPSSYPIRTSVPPGRPLTTNRLPVIQDYGPRPGEPLLVQQPIEPIPVALNPKDGLFVRFLKVGAWGAGEGFFEMALNFFRKRRPE